MKELSHVDLENEVRRLRAELAEANDTLHAIRSGQIDALIVNGESGHAVFTLRSADRAYRLFIEQMTEGAVTLNREGLIVYSNSQFATLVQQPLPKIMGNYFSDFVFEEDVALFKESLSKGWTTNVKCDLRLKASNKTVDVQMSFNILEMDDEVSLSVIVTDLTQQKEIQRELKAKNYQLGKLNEALVASNHDLQQFASVASHDLQEPLRKIQVFSKFLQSRAIEELSGGSRIYVDKIFRAAQRMKILIVDILTYSKLSAEDVRNEMVDLKELVTEILEDFDLRIEEQKAKVDVSDLCVVQGNRGQIRQVFHNLISNSLKFVFPNRPPAIHIRSGKFDPAELNVSVADPSQYCLITVTDNGIGFDEAYASSIFSLFETLNPKTEYEGSGIGLSIAKKIIEKHHGLISAKSKAGVGSVFNLILPFKQPV
jgi:two-component system CheB/CheR fusion protein